MGYAKIKMDTKEVKRKKKRKEEVKIEIAHVLAKIFYKRNMSQRA